MTACRELPRKTTPTNTPRRGTAVRLVAGALSVVNWRRRRHDVAVQCPRSILIVRKGMIGDVIQTTALLGDLRLAFPDARIAYMTGSAGAAVLRRNPHVDEVLPYLDFPGRRAADALGFIKRVRQLRQARFDLGISLNNASWDAMILRLAGVWRSVGFVEPLREFLLDEALVWDEDETRPRQERFDDILRTLGIEPRFRRYVFPVDSAVGEHARAVVQEAADSGRELLAVAPGGARHPPGADVYRQWLPERFAEVLRKLSDRYNMLPVLVGDADDAEVARTVLASLPADKRGQTRNLAGHTTLECLAFLLAHASLLVTNDSAPVWIAAAVGCPTVSIFGCNHPAVNLPLAKWYASVKCSLPCHPCYRGDRIPACPVPPGCVTEVKTEDVIRAAADLLRQATSGRSVDFPGTVEEESNGE